MVFETEIINLVGPLLTPYILAFLAVIVLALQRQQANFGNLKESFWNRLRARKV